MRKKQFFMKKPVSCFMAMVFALLCVMTALSGILSERVYADEIVKVGYVEMPNFMEGATDGAHKSGYAYEYMQKVAMQCGWKYAYVYGSWAEMYTKLKNGEIDVMAGVSYSDDRAKEIDFPNYSMGTENYYVYVYDKGVALNPGIEALKGKTVGCVRGTIESAYFENWNEQNGYGCEIKLFSDNGEQYSELEKGLIDAIVDSDVLVVPEDSLIPVANINRSEYFLAVNKNRPELLAELNKGLEELNLTEPHLANNLHNKYFSESMGRMKFTEAEEEWILSNSTIRIGYEKNFLSYCGYDENTGELKGALKVFVNSMKENFADYNIKIETIPYANVQDSIVALKRGKIDVVFPLYQSVYEAERCNVLLTKPVASTAMTAIVADRNSFDEFSDNTVAVAKGFTDIHWFLSEEYPNWTIRQYDTFEDCVNAVHAGEVDCIVESTYVYKTLVDYRTIQMVSLSKGAEVSFVVDNSKKELLSIMNHAISLNPNAQFVSNLTQYANVDRKTTFGEFAKDNILILGISVGMLILVLAILLLRTRDSEKKAKRAEAEKSKLFEEKEQQLKEIISLNISIKQEKRRAEAANNAKTTFLFNMSHDIRTPMNAIIGFTDLIEKNIDDQEKIRDYIRKIQSSNTFLLSLINNVLEMAKIESGKMALDLVYWDVEAFNDTIYSVFSDLMENSGLEFTRSVDVKHKAVMCDATKVREIFLNLLSNAQKYTPSGGTVSMELTELPCDKEGYALYKTVISDNGIGMSQEYIGRIFDEFSREKSSTESRVAGSGLGMAIVKKLVEFMDGTIRVESEMGVGTKITVTLPLLVANEEDRPKVQKYEESFDRSVIEGKRVLLAEDNDLNAEIAITVLEDMGLLVDRASDGVICIDLLEKADSEYYQLILMDVQMPNMNGYQTTEIIRKMSDIKKANLPIVAMTANAFEEDRQNAIRAGMNAHLAKPINIKELAKTIASLL